MNNSSVSEYLDNLAAKKSTPGGGAAAALTAAQGAALLSMVCNFSQGEKYQAVQEDIDTILKASESARKRLLSLANEDEEVFSKVMAAYKLPKENDSQKKIREGEIQVCLIDCAQVPLELMQECRRLFEYIESLKEIGNKNLISDVFVGAHLLYAGILSGKENVLINLNSINDKNFCEEMNTKVDTIIKEAQEIYKKI